MIDHRRKATSSAVEAGHSCTAPTRVEAHEAGSKHARYVSMLSGFGTRLTDGGVNVNYSHQKEKSQFRRKGDIGIS